MRPITHVIYDLDGTLLDTEPLYQVATQEILDRFGVTLTAELRSRMVGRPTPIAAQVLVEATGIPLTAAEFAQERDRKLAVLFPSVPPTRGAAALTAHLRAHGVPQAIATSSLRHSMASKRLSNPAWFDSFDAIVTAEDVAQGKPAPDIFLEAARRLGAQPGSCLVFEDAPAGVQAALAAGMWVIALPEPGHGHLMGGAHQSISHLEEFDPRRWGLPAFPEQVAG
jgi:HAD superfamily hydrolase (TIGR01509 family)